ncbi:hypothetical protein M433DRAFT_62085 [Acidomyces richmondensis BFW]|nr:MAG: hypothetical protein FE78DRAFT_139398 [Acidomyces sp. 'richmondensis']KYG47927.1 hypothetical protein M433DRAFT_62085 [Acidomyces richmondensis BFW]
MSQVGADAVFTPLHPGQAPTTAAGTEQSLVSSAGQGESVVASTPLQDANNTSGVGAGPLPTGFGMPAPQGSSTLTEFTKRRNWSQRIIEELKDFLHILTPDGRILYVSPSCKAITGYEAHMLIGKFISEYVHPDDSGIFMREFNESIASGNNLRFFYRFKKEDGTYRIFECDGHPHISHEPAVSGQGYNQSLARGNGAPIPGLCRGFFMMARPYPTGNAALLDSFLEHKIENERLLKRIEELKREEMEENAEQDRLYREQGMSHPGTTPSESRAPASRPPIDGSSEKSTFTPNHHGMPPPAKPAMSNTALTQKNLDSALSAQKPDSIADKMSRYEASSSHLEGIELITGLRYRDGERSHGISTGDTSPALIRGDAGIAILLDRDRDGSKKEKKKLKVADEYVCADCGTLDSPEWRKGPKGPKTLCNACGLRWAKKEKKRMGEDSKTASPSGGMQSHVQQMSGTLPQPPGMPMHTSTGSS